MWQKEQKQWKEQAVFQIFTLPGNVLGKIAQRGS